MKKVIEFILGQLKQPSTWRGLIMLSASMGLISSEHTASLGVCANIIAAAFAGSGLVGIMAKS